MTNTATRLPAPRPVISRSQAGARVAKPTVGRNAGVPAVVSAAQLLHRCDEGVRLAEDLSEAGERFCAAQLAAIRAAAAVLAVRGRPRRGSGVLNVWEVLPRVAPELAEWAAFFSGNGKRRASIEAGVSGVVTVRDADDLCRSTREFSRVVADLLGLLALTAD